MKEQNERREEIRKNRARKSEKPNSVSCQHPPRSQHLAVCMTQRTLEKIFWVQVSTQCLFYPGFHRSVQIAEASDMIGQPQHRGMITVISVDRLSYDLISTGIDIITDRSKRLSS